MFLSKKDCYDEIVFLKQFLQPLDETKVGHLMGGTSHLSPNFCKSG